LKEFGFGAETWLNGVDPCDSTLGAIFLGTLGLATNAAFFA